MPVVFVSHGAPDALLKAPDAAACWREIGRQAPAPEAVLAVSAHWQARHATLSLAGAPQTLHDFSGFAPALHCMQYPAPGAPSLAERAVSLIAAAGLVADLHPDRGLDHGAWVPLSVMYPQANVPVAQLSLVRNGSAADHFALGRALAPLRDEGVLILASGAVTHNFDWLDWRGEAEPLSRARAFSDWVGARLEASDIPALLDYRATRYGAEAHPSEEHFLPLFVALGAAEDGRPVRHQPRYTYGSLAMDAYVWQYSQQ
jgi:4,5-DOPA dioxygenase extradiol